MQPAADQQYWQLVNSFSSPYFAGTTPPQVNYPFTENAALGVAQNPFAGQALQGAQAGAATGGGIGSDLSGVDFSGLTNIASAFPGLGAAAGATTAQPITQLQQALNTALGIIPTLGDLSNRVASPMGQLQGAAGPLAGQATSLIPQEQGAASSILETGFDPRNALYNRLRQQSLDQSSAANAMAGLGSSPYGASLTGDTLNNLNIDWDNQQLARQAQAAQTAGGLASQIAGQAGTGANILSGLDTAAGNLGTGAAGILSRIPTTATEAGGLATNIGNLSGMGLNQGITGLNAGLSGLGGIGALGGQIAGLEAGTAGLPYQTSTGQAQNTINALGSATQQGLEQFNLPSSAISDLANYLQLGRNASLASGQLGQQGFNQGQTQLSGLGSLSPFLFGSQGLTGALGINPTTGLLGGLGGAGGGAALGAAGDFSSAPELLSAADAAGVAGGASGGGGLLSLLGLK